MNTATEVEDSLPSYTKEASSIQAIDKKSVHRICSGQVVLTLATAVKELVENSIDAGATCVEIRLKDYGSESIEVIDNGCGVEEKNFEGLTLKHFTSKLQDFEDLINVSTFGFRGEALSSLCALSKMTIITRHSSVSVGTRLDFDINGKIIEKKNTPRQIGTTVIVQNIFHTLPVRHKEFQRNLKKEFARLVQVLNAYCIINTGVRITCLNQTSKGNRSTIVGTNGNSHIKDNITNVFGPKQLLSLLEFNQIDPKEEICTEFGIKHQSGPGINFKVSGYVSKCEHGQGRSTSDRQFLFINKRPCDASKMIKVVNEVYHSYNRHQNPFIALHIQMNKESVDVNVTPDKRQIFVDGEKQLLAVLKTSLIEMFEPTTAVYKLNNTLSSPAALSFSSDSIPSPKTEKSPSKISALMFGSPNSSPSGTSLSSSLSNLKRSFASAFDKNKNSPCSPLIPKSCKKSQSFPSSSPSFLKSGTPKADVNANSMLKFVSSFSKRESSLTESSSTGKDSCISSTPSRPSLKDVKETSQTIYIDCQDKVNQETSLKEFNSESVFELENGMFGREDETNNINNSKATMLQDFIDTTKAKFPPRKELLVIPVESVKTNQHSEVIKPNDENYSVSNHSIPEETHEQNRNQDTCLHITDKDLTVEGEGKVKRKEVTIKFSLENLRNRINKNSESSSSFSRSFRAKICPGDNQSAEEELAREISKDMFAKMKIRGQFNLGFIITQLGNDLFIVDQHATDEKFNFEMLRQNTVLQSQRLIVPQNLDLTASNETILVDNLDIFKKNGFDFIIDTEAPPTQRVKLISAPVSKNWNFGKDDIEELLFMLTDSPNVMCRPSRIRMMFASRACRKSIMIGTALNHSEMKRLVNHMGEIEQPWNCPHGRPTMRHLFNMNMLPS